MLEKLNNRPQEEFELATFNEPRIPARPPQPSARTSSSPLIYISIILFAIVIKVLQPLAIASSKKVDGSYRYNESTMVLLVEWVKLGFCGLVFFFQYKGEEISRRKSLYNLTAVESLHFIMPAILYAASNTLVYYGMSYINPALFHVFGNTRILTTGIMYRLMMGKKLSDLQWIGLVLIASGAIIASPGSENPDPTEDYLLGLVMVVMMTMCSTAASIYTEKFFKKTEEVSIFYQNAVLYAYGILINTFLVILTRNETKKIFDGFDQAGLLVLAAQSAMGISLSFIFKYLDNIVYVISLTCSMFLTVIFGVIFFGFSLDLSILTSLTLITLGVYLFYRHKLLERYHIRESDTFI